MAGAYRTTQDLVTKVLANLGVLEAGQAIDPEDYQYVVSDLDSIFRMLAAIDVAYVPDANNIPGAMFSALADIVAGEVCVKFGSTVDDRSMLIAKGLGVPPGTGAAALTLKQMSMGRPTYQRQTAEYF